MPSPKLTAVITALLLLSGASQLLAAYNLEQLKEIERLVLAKDTAALGRYLAANPQITMGDDPLARELRDFRGCASSGQLDCFSARRVTIAKPEPDPVRTAIPIY